MEDVLSDTCCFSRSLSSSQTAVPFVSNLQKVIVPSAVVAQVRTLDLRVASRQGYE